LGGGIRRQPQQREAYQKSAERNRRIAIDLIEATHQRALFSPTAEQESARDGRSARQIPDGAESQVQIHQPRHFDFRAKGKGICLGG
jgi:hypothetical protein